MIKFQPLFTEVFSFLRAWKTRVFSNLYFPVFIKKRLQHRCFSVKFLKLLRRSFLQNTPCQLSWVAYPIFSFWWYGMTIFNDLEASENTHWPTACHWLIDQCSQHIETSQLVCRPIRISLLMYMLHLKCIRFLLFLNLDICEIPTGTPMSIRRRPDFEEFPSHFHVLIRCNLADRKIHLASTYFFRHNFAGRKIHVVSTYFFRCNFDGWKI